MKVAEEFLPQHAHLLTYIHVLHYITLHYMDPKLVKNYRSIRDTGIHKYAHANIILSMYAICTNL
jgi:hypothetical protein